MSSLSCVNKLVIDHSYSLGIAWDKTEYRNHGLLCQTPPGTGFFQGSLSFTPGRTSPGSAIIVPHKRSHPDSLDEMGAVRVHCFIYTLSPGGGTERQNIVEGHLSFAFFINPDLSLEGTFLDSNGNWIGIRSRPRSIVPNQWFEVDYWYDGISRSRNFGKSSKGRI